MRGSNIPIAALGAFILWLGWFGFNGGSQLAVHTVDNANAVAQVFLNTNAAAAGGVLGAIIISKVLTGKMDVTMGINGAIAGLVAITAAPDTPSGGLATIIGAVGGVLVYFSVVFFDSVLKVDDPVGAISAHGTVGVWGIMATPLSGAGAFGTQAIGAVSIFLWTFITAGATLLVIKAIMGLRPTLEDEMEGMDASEVGVSAYPEFSE
jgi:Amt family ammonium transporter